jgi:hypothetical protein
MPPESIIEAERESAHTDLWNNSEDELPGWTCDMSRFEPVGRENHGDARE